LLLNLFFFELCEEMVFSIRALTVSFGNCFTEDFSSYQMNLQHRERSDRMAHAPNLSPLIHAVKSLQPLVA